MLSLALCGCGSSPAGSSSVCLPGAQRLVAQTLALRPTSIATVRGIGNDGAPQCTFSARLSGGERFEVTVNVDVEPQPYTILSRTIVEGQQVFGPRRLTPAPVAVLNLGLLASWFPGPSQLMSTDGLRMVTTTVNWAGTKQGKEIRFATRLSRLYLRRARPSLAHGAPAGG